MGTLTLAMRLLGVDDPCLRSNLGILVLIIIQKHEYL